MTHTLLCTAQLNSGTRVGSCPSQVYVHTVSLKLDVEASDRLITVPYLLTGAAPVNSGGHWLAAIASLAGQFFPLGSISMGRAVSCEACPASILPLTSRSWSDMLSRVSVGLAILGYSLLGLLLVGCNEQG